MTVRQWRELTRLRKKYVQSVGDYRKRTHKLFESANIKIDSVVSDLFGVTGRNLMKLADCGSGTDIVGYQGLCSWETQGQRGGAVSIHSGVLHGSSPIYSQDDLGDDRHAGGAD